MENKNNDGFLQQAMVCAAPLRRKGVRIAVVVHIFYPDLAREIYGFLRNIIEPFDLIITTPHKMEIAELIDLFTPLASGVVVALSENRGRDVGPFIAVHRKRILEGYDAVLKLHSKKSKYTQGGTHWRRHQYHHLCGNSQIVRNSIALLRSGHAGMIGVHDCYFSHPMYWGGKNRPRVHRLLQSSGTQTFQEKDVPLGFFAGTMFWYVPDALKQLHEIPDSMLQFEPENAQMDGTLAHALERLFGVLPRQAGYTVTSLQLKGKDLAEISTREHNSARWLC